MEITAFDLAARIIEDCDGKFDESSTAQLANLLLQGAGILRSERHYIVLLDSQLVAYSTHLPTCIIGKDSIDQSKKVAIKEGQVAAFFRQRERMEPFKKPEGYQANWVPLPNRQSSKAPIPLGGSLYRAVRKAENPQQYANDRYYWCTLTHVPVGEIVYRLDALGDLHVFQRLNGSFWAQVELKANAWRAIDIVSILQERGTDKDPVQGLWRGDLKYMAPPLVQQPPTD